LLIIKHDELSINRFYLERIIQNILPQTVEDILLTGPPIASRVTGVKTVIIGEGFRLLSKQINRF